MPRSSRITIRLSPVLAARLAAKAGPRGHVADIVRQAIEAYLNDQSSYRLPPQPQVAAMTDTADTVAVIMRRLVDIEQRIAALEAQAATRPPPAATATPRGRTPLGVPKLTPHQAAALRAKRQGGAKVKELMQEFGLSKASVFRYLAAGDVGA